MIKERPMFRDVKRTFSTKTLGKGASAFFALTNCAPLSPIVMVFETL